MTSSAAKIHVLFAVLATCLTACGPTKPPGDELGAAARNLNSARSAGAATYAPNDLRAAQDHLAQANAAAARQDYDDAAVLAAESGVDSELAVARSRLGKVREANTSLKQQNADLARDAAPHTDGADAR
jgi:outer membrane murein-binding lipoprotein Lpp